MTGFRVTGCVAAVLLGGLLVCPSAYGQAAAAAPASPAMAQVFTPGVAIVDLNTPKRSWGTEQVLGEPDTFAAGDIQTAWASQSQDEQPEWLLLEYGEAVKPKAVSVHETYNPGALVRVSVFDTDGREVVAWEGSDPTASDKDKGISVIPVRVPFATRYVKIYLDSQRVTGWNEIDAVSLTDRDGNVQWASRAAASTTYAQNTAPDPNTVVVQQMARIQELEARLRDETARRQALERRLRELEKALQDKRQPAKELDGKK